MSTPKMSHCPPPTARTPDGGGDEWRPSSTSLYAGWTPRLRQTLRRDDLELCNVDQIADAASHRDFPGLSASTQHVSQLSPFRGDGLNVAKRRAHSTGMALKERPCSLPG